MISINHNITIIICAYNEEKTIGNILEPLLHGPTLYEIIVVNDGSTDSTGSILYRFRSYDNLKIIELPTNMGKGFAMAEGIINAHSSILVFVDADLINFHTKYIDQLIQPLIEKKADMVIGQPTEVFADFHLNPFKPLAGERALFRHDIIPLIDKMKESRFGVETLINLHYKAISMKTVYESLQGLQHPTKLQKYPLYHSIQEYGSAAKQIAQTVLINFTFVIAIIRNIFIR